MRYSEKFRNKVALEVKKHETRSEAKRGGAHMRKALQKPRMKKNASEEQSDAFFSSKWLNR